MALKYFMLSVVYLLVSLIWVLIFAAEPVALIKRSIQMAELFVGSLVSSVSGILVICGLVVLSRFYHGWRSVGWVEILSTALLSLIGIAIFSAAFGLFKSSFLVVTPFYADEMFMAMDRWLLFGRDAWSVAHEYVPNLGPKVIDLIYGRLWIPFVLIFPLALLLLDKNRERIARYIVLNFVVFFFVGNVLALTFLSVGPVYFDQYYAANSFSGLPAALEASGVSASHIGYLQSALGDVFFANGGEQAVAISAFPSVHVAAISTVMLYALERSRIIGSMMVLLTGAILFLSVYTGYHWLVDGLASIFIMIGANMALKQSQLTEKLAKWG